MTPEQRQNRIICGFILLSLLLHLLLLLVPSDKLLPVETIPKPVYVEVRPAPQLKDRELDLPMRKELEKPRETPAKRLAEKDQVVEKETAPEGKDTEDRQQAVRAPKPTPKPPAEVVEQPTPQPPVQPAPKPEPKPPAEVVEQPAPKPEPKPPAEVVKQPAPKPESKPPAKVVEQPTPQPPARLTPELAPKPKPPTKATKPPRTEAPPQETAKATPAPPSPEGSQAQQEKPEKRSLENLPDLNTLTQISPNALARIESDWRRKYREDIAKGDTVWMDTERDLLISFMRRFRTNIYNVWNYPSDAAAQNQQGTCLLRITVDREGNVTDVRLLESSGHRTLDEEAIHAVRKGASYGPLPRAYPNPDLKIMAFFQYHMSGTVTRSYRRLPGQIY